MQVVDRRARALAREAVERPEDDDLELPLVRVLEERLESSAAPGGTRFLISIFLDQLPALVTIDEGAKRPARVSQRRCVALSRIDATSRMRVVMPGRRTRRSRSHCQLPIAVETLDLGRVFPVGLAALSVLGETAHIWETQLCRDVGGSPRGYVPDIRQEPAEGANRAELYGVPQAVGLTPSPINVASVLVVKEEVALELSLFDLADVATVRGGLVVVEEVYRHPAMVSNSRPLPLSVRFRSIVPQPPNSESGSV